MALAQYDAFQPIKQLDYEENVAAMSMIPGLFTTNLGLGQNWPTVSSSSYEYNPAPVSQAHIVPVQPYTPSPVAPGPISSPHPDFIAPVHPGQMANHGSVSPPNIQIERQPVQLPFHPPPPPVSISSIPLTIERGGLFRPSVYELEPDLPGLNNAPEFETTVFKK